MSYSAKPNTLAFLAKIDFAEIVFFHQFDQSADAFDIKYIVPFGGAFRGSSFRFFTGFRHCGTFRTKKKLRSNRDLRGLFYTQVCRFRQERAPDKGHKPHSELATGGPLPQELPC